VKEMKDWNWRTHRFEETEEEEEEEDDD